MKRFIGFVIKEFYHIFRDKRTMLILFGMPLSQVLLFGFVLTNEIKDAKIALLDHSKDHVTQEITNKLLSSGYFQATEYLTNTDQIESTFKKGKVKEIVVFEPDFALKLEKEKRYMLLMVAGGKPSQNLCCVSPFFSLFPVLEIGKVGLSCHSPAMYCLCP